MDYFDYQGQSESGLDENDDQQNRINSPSYFIESKSQKKRVKRTLILATKLEQYEQNLLNASQRLQFDKTNDVFRKIKNFEEDYIMNDQININNQDKTDNRDNNQQKSQQQNQQKSQQQNQYQQQQQQNIFNVLKNDYWTRYISIDQSPSYDQTGNIVQRSIVGNEQTYQNALKQKQLDYERELRLLVQKKLFRKIINKQIIQHDDKISVKKQLNQQTLATYSQTKQQQLQQNLSGNNNIKKNSLLMKITNSNTENQNNVVGEFQLSDHYDEIETPVLVPQSKSTVRQNLQIEQQQQIQLSRQQTQSQEDKKYKNIKKNEAEKEKFQNFPKKQLLEEMKDYLVQKNMTQRKLQKIVNQLPLEEKNIVTKEERILENYQKYQKKWQNQTQYLQQQLQKKHDEVIEKPLLIVSSDEFRRKKELVECRESMKNEEELYGRQFWQINLRNNTQINEHQNIVYDAKKERYFCTEAEPQPKRNCIVDIDNKFTYKTINPQKPIEIIRKTSSNLIQQIDSSKYFKMPINGSQTQRSEVNKQSVINKFNNNFDENVKQIDIYKKIYHNYQQNHLLNKFSQKSLSKTNSQDNLKKIYEYKTHSYSTIDLMRQQDNIINTVRKNQIIQNQKQNMIAESFQNLTRNYEDLEINGQNIYNLELKQLQNDGFPNEYQYKVMNKIQNQGTKDLIREEKKNKSEFNTKQNNNNNLIFQQQQQIQQPVEQKGQQQQYGNILQQQNKVNFDSGDNQIDEAIDYQNYEKQSLIQNGKHFLAQFYNKLHVKEEKYVKKYQNKNQSNF